MKRKILFVLILAVLFSACKMKLSENIGTVIIDLRNDLRAVGENGLPVLKDSELTIKVTKIDESYNESDIKGETFAPGNPNKTLTLTLPVGEKIKVRVRVKNVTAQWYGESAVHTVTEGSNTISVKLKKSAAALNSLLFGTDKSHSGGHHDYTLTLKIGSEEIKKKDIKDHNFCRDNKGRTYLAYQKNRDWNIERYTSEGEKENKPFTLPVGCHRLILASDHTTGAVYLVAEISGVMKLYRINEDGTHTELTGDPIGYTTGYAVYNNVVVASGYASGVQGPVLKMYRVNGDNLSEITLSTPQPNLSEDTKIMLGSFSDPLVRINDLYMTENTLYVLFSGYNHSGKPYSLGGIVRYSCTAESTSGTISNPKRIGIKSDHTADAHGIYATDDNNFYGPVKVVGFDAENLYIADDGVRFEFEKGKPRIKENKNRIATLNRNDDTIIFTDAASGISWQNESPVWTGVNTKTLVWTKNENDYGFDYYQLENAGDTLPTETFKPGEGNVSSDNYFTDVFCYDEGGNLYIVEYKGSVGALPKYQICRFELQDEGSYNTSPVIARLYESSHNPLSYKPTAIAVDTSGNVSSGKNVLYYSYKSTESVVKRIEWNNDNFASANFNNLWKIADPPSIDVKTQFTSLAANQDGLFVGEFLKRVSQGDHKYKIHVKKYPHDSPNYGDPQGTIIIVDEAQQIDDIEESLNALYIQDGVLYGLTTKEFRNEHNGANEPQKASISGKLWKIGKTDFSGDSTLENPLYSSEPKPWPGNDNQWKECGKFAPYRFIAVKPKKLVIASDGFYGYMKSGQRKADQLQFIWNFDLKADGSTDGNGTSYNKGEGITFSKSLKNDSYFSWN